MDGAQMPVVVRQVRLPKDITPFLDVWWEIYKTDAHWVPPLRFERRHFFDATKNPYFRHAHAAYFMAYKDEKAVGTISAQIDNLSLQKTPGLGYFGFFEFEDDPEVSEALLSAARNWLGSQGITRMQGPFNFSTNHECGLLVDGFDGDPLVMMTYNPSYYLSHYDRMGLVKAMDLYAYWLDAKTPIPDTLTRMNERFLSRHPDVKIRPVNLENLESEMKILLTIYNDAWEDNWGSIRMDEDEMKKVVEDIRPMLDTRFCYFLEIGGEPAALSVTLPDYNQVVKPMNGKLLPFGWYYWLTRPKKVNQLRVLVLGVRKKFQSMPVGLPLYMKTWEEGLKAGVRGAEASWILESNSRMRSALEKLGGTIYRTYRIYERSCE